MGFIVDVIKVAVLAAIPLATALPQSNGWQTGPCTYHDYEGDKARLGAAYDNSPGWCGIRYSALDVSRVVAIGGMSASECAQCVEFQSASGAGPAVYVLAIDEKVAGGLDVALTSFQDAFPGSNPLDPQTCTWRFVDPSMCSGICFGSSLECTPGQRNLLPPQLLPPLGSPSNGPSPKSLPVPDTPSSPVPQQPDPTPCTTTTDGAEPTESLTASEQPESTTLASLSTSTSSSTSTSTAISSASLAQETSMIIAGLSPRIVGAGYSPIPLQGFISSARPTAQSSWLAHSILAASILVAAIWAL